jgi:hypothetical protein
MNADTGHAPDGRKGLQSLGIQVEKPPQPWELPGYFRLDCEPDRGDLLYRSAIVGLVLSIVSFPLLGLPLLAAFPLSLAIWSLARRDLALMRKGMMDPGGETPTLLARDLGCAAFLCCSGALLLWLLLLQEIL